MNLELYLNKDNLHHAYLIEGVRDEVVPELKKFIESLGVKTSGNADFVHIHIDTFKVDNALELKTFGGQRGLTSGKKIFIISTNSFLLEAQNALLKMFEEPIENTHFFLIVPDVNSLIKTITSRFYVIRSNKDNRTLNEEAEKFLTLKTKDRIDFIKDLLLEPEEEDEEGNEILPMDSVRANALNFLNSLENSLHQKLGDNYTQASLINSLEHILKVRKYLRMPGSSAKSLVESLALIIPSL